jgi:hypothetical protein
VKTKEETMISSLQEAETIVYKNKNLFWDGWTIVRFKPNPNAEFNKSGLRRNNIWGYATRYEPTKTGWRLPNEVTR